MSTSFPTGLDDFDDPAGGETLGGSSPTHTQAHRNLNDAVESLETKVGADGSGDPASLDSRVVTLETSEDSLTGRVVTLEAGGGPVGGLDAGMTADARHVADGVTTAGSTTVTSATAAFVAGDVGKIVHVSTGRYTGSVVSTTGASTTVTAAGATFTAADVGRSIEIEAAATGDQTFFTTITAFGSSTSITVAAAPNLTVNTANAYISAMKTTTVASRTNATTIVVASAPAWTGTGADLVVGTDNSATWKAAVNSARVANLPLIVTAGTYLCKLTDGTETTDLNAGDLSIVGAGRDQTEIITVHAVRPGDTSVVNFVRLLGGTLNVRDITFRNVGIDGEDDLGSAGLGFSNPTCFYNEGADAAGNNEMRFSRVDCVGFGRATVITGGQSYRSRTYIQDCTFSSRIDTISHFRGDGSGDHECHVLDSRVETTQQLGTAGQDDVFNTYCSYIHPNVARIWRNVDSYLAQDADGKCIAAVDGQHIRSFGNPTTAPLRQDHIEGCRFSGGGIAIRTNHEGTGVPSRTTNIINCRFETRAGILALAPFRVTDSSFACGQQAIRLETDTASAPGCFFVVDGCDFTNESRTQTQGGTENYILTGQVGSTWVFNNCRFHCVNDTNSSLRYIAGASANHRVVFRDCLVNGGASNAEGFFQYPDATTADAASVVFDTCNFEGEWGANIVVSGAMDSDDFYPIRFDRCRFLHTAGAFMATNLDFKNGNIGGQDNYFASGTEPSGDAGGSRSLAFVPRKKRSPTALTVTSNLLSPNFNHDAFTVTGAATVNNIYVGGTANKNRARAGELYLTAVTGTVTLAHNAGGTGNIRCAGAANKAVAAGDTVLLRADERNGVWYVIG